MTPGLQLKRVRERLGLTYRDVERSSSALASRKGRTEFVLHISRLAEIENHGVVPSLHKLYSLAVVYHLNPIELLRWYEVPLDEFFGDAATFPARETHLMAPPISLEDRENRGFDPERTELLSSTIMQRHGIKGVLPTRENTHRYGYIGLSDRRMTPILRPGSIVLVDTSVRRVQEANWSTEYDRPMYFVELHEGYRCGWFCKDGSRLMMEPHPLSRCVPESWATPDEAEVIGQVVGMVTRMSDPEPIRSGSVKNSN